jgi:hypothetical protein
MEPKHLLCPSALPEMPEGRLFGVMGGSATEPRLMYLDEPAPVTESLLSLAGPVKPTEVFRLAAPCVESKCCHFDGQDCRLVTRIVQILPAVVDSLPACVIRKECRWFQQEGRPACMRCPQVVTLNCAASDDMVRAATPASV